MSLSQQKIPESKSKSKFQSLNINNLYQGAASRPQSKGPAQKHGLQSLGKVPTARRAPANLPSVKSEKGGNDPTVVLVPTGGGWASKDGEKEGVEGGRRPEEQGGEKGAKEAGEAKSPSPQAKPQQPLSWAGTVTGGTAAARPTNQWGHQKSPGFGKEFPGLAGDAQAGGAAPQQEAGPADPAYGPGPNLRPQALAGWSQGGRPPGGPPTEGGPDPTGPQVQPHKPVAPAGTARSPATAQYKSIMPGFMEALELPAGPPAGHSSGRRAIARNGGPPRHREQRPRPAPLPDNRPSIIDQDTLKRMDVTGGDDWTYEDDDFDYNKKLQSDDEETPEPAAPAPAADPNWADQVPGGAGQPPKPSPPQPQYNFYDEFKQKGGVGFGVDEEEKRRNKKSEEVMKNIERARQRREEEENRYRRPGGQDVRQEAGGREQVARRGGGGRNYEERERGERGQERSQEPYRRREEREEEHGPRPAAGFQGGRREREGQLWGDIASQQQPFDMEAEEKRRQERPPSQGRSPGAPQPRQEEASQEAVAAGWGDGRAGQVPDWAEDVERVTEYDQYQGEGVRDYDRPNRPHSRDSTVSKESRGSRDGKGPSRRSQDREVGFGVKKEDKVVKAEKDVGKAEQEQQERRGRGKAAGPAPPQELRGWAGVGFQGGLEGGRALRQAPGPITRERLEQAEPRDGMTSLTTLKKREPGKQEEKVEEVEKQEVSSATLSLIDPDMLENISDDEDNFEGNDIEKEAAAVGGRGRGGRGRGGRGGGEAGKPAGPRAVGGAKERGARGGRGGRAEGKRGGLGGQNRWNETEEVEEAGEDRRGLNKPFGAPSAAVGGQWGFLPRGQPSRRGRGGAGRAEAARGGGAGPRPKGFEEIGQTEEMGEWGEEEAEKRGGGRGKAAGRGQKGKKEAGPRPGSGGAEEGEEWETASETSLEERERRSKVAAPVARGGGRGGARGRGQPAGNCWEARGGRRGGAPGQEVKEGTPEPKMPNIDNFEHAGVAVADDTAWNEEQIGGDFGGEMGGDFMQVMNKRGRGGGPVGPPGKEREQRRPLEQRAMPERGGYGRGPPGPEMFDKKMSKTAYDRRQSKLPPRLAKQREVSRAQARGGPGQLSPGPGAENGWPEGDKMGVFSVEPDIGTGAWEKSPDIGVKVDNGIANSGTLIFENTAFKGGKADKPGAAGGAIQLPLSFSKQDSDNGDLKLDFTFGGEEGVLKPGSGAGPPLTISRSGLPASPSTDDLQTKLAGTKKLWDQPGMATVPEGTATGGCNWNEADVYGETAGDVASDAVADKAGPSPVSNVAKVKPRQQQQQQQLGLDGDARASSSAMHNPYNRMAVPSPPGTHAGMPPSHMPPSVQPWAFMPDRSSPMYNPYSGLNQQSILMPGAHSMGTDLFNSNNGGFRSVPTFPGSGVGLTTSGAGLISQASIINTHGQNKQGSGIGPIGSKAGGQGQGGSPYLTSLPNTNSNIFIQHPAAYDGSGNPLNPYMAQQQAPHPSQAGRSMPQQTAFYHQLNRLNQQQAYNALQGFAGQQHQHALSQQQMRASAVAGMPFKMTEQAKSPVSMDSGFQQAPGGPYNGRGVGGQGPPSPKTKMKMAQQQEQAKMTANLNNLNLNANLNANVNLLAQMQMQSGRGIGMGQYGHIGGMVQPAVPGQYNPSPIARPQVSDTAGPWGRAPEQAQPAAGQPGKQANQYFSPEAGPEATEEPAQQTEKAEQEAEATVESAAPLEAGGGQEAAAATEEAPGQA